jgi:hypothetical protein
MQIRRAARRRLHGAPGGCADHDVHRVAGPAADDPQHVQDRRRADPDGLPRGGALRGNARPVDLRRSLRRDGARDRPASRCSPPARAGSPGHGAISQAATLEARVPFLHFFDGFRTSHEVQQDRKLADEDLSAIIDAGLVRPIATGAEPGQAVTSRHGPEPRHVLPGPRGLQPVLQRSPRHRQRRHGPLRKLTGGSTSCSTTSVPRTPSASSSSWARRRDDRRDGRTPEQGREGRRGQGAALPAVPASRFVGRCPRP